MNVFGNTDNGSRSRASTWPNTRFIFLTRVGDEEYAPSLAVSTSVQRSVQNAKKERTYYTASDNKNKKEDNISMTSTGTRRLTRRAKSEKIWM